MADYGLIGEKLGHSFSAVIHREFGYDYELRELSPDQVPAFTLSPPYKGFNVTIPYKRTVMPYLDEIHPHAAAIGAVNTVVNRGGRRVGYNTDLAGMRYALDRYGIEVQGKEVLILGSGGTGHTARALMDLMGAKRVRTVSREGELNYGNLAEQGADAEVIINTTPVGMYPHGAATPVSLDMFPRLQGVFDAIYNPLSTRLVAAARNRGIAAGNGLVMLVAQAKYARDLFMGDTAPNGEIERIYKKIEKDKQNVVLVGMAGCGKSTIGKAVAAKLNKRFVDTDEVIAERYGLTIPDVFARFGEAAFRQTEQEVAAELGAQNGLVIATGGGLPMNGESRLNLKSNGFTVYLTRNPERLDRRGRPLSTDLNRVKELLALRAPTYRSMADITVENEGSIEACVNRVVEEFLK